MRPVDVWLQDWREWKAQAWVPAGVRLLDIGCHQGEFLERLGTRIGPSVGIDPIASPRTTPGYRLLRGTFEDCGVFPDGAFDAISMLAVIEHVAELDPLIEECRRLLTPGGRVVLTVPSPAVDHVLTWLIRLRIVDGMSLEQHHGLEPSLLPAAFQKHGFILERWRPFQLGLNHLMVFRRPSDVRRRDTPAIGP